MSNEKKYSSNATLDLAIILGLGSGILYLVGWNYWVAFYAYFGIDQSFIDLTFYQVIASTWWLLPFFFLYIFYPLLFLSSGSVKSIRDLRVTLFNVAIVLLLISIPILISFLDLWIAILIAIIPSILVIYYRQFLEKKSHNIGRVIKNDIVIKLLMGFLLIFLSVVANQIYGKNAAQDLAHGGVHHKINILLKKGKKLENYILITHMGGKYFICKKANSDERPRTIVINESDVKKAILIPK